MACKSAAKAGVELFQIETRNPHLHEEKGEEHLKDMLLPGLGTIYHSSLCEDVTKAKIIDELRRYNAIEPNEKPPLPQLCQPPKIINKRKFKAIMEERMALYSTLEEH
jgi:mannosyl-3-phosphoglycerate synthase